MTGSPILSIAELSREAVVLAHVEAETRVVAMARRRAARIADKAAIRANLVSPRSTPVALPAAMSR